jgi:hypothetical protein
MMLGGHKIGHSQFACGALFDRRTMCIAIDMIKSWDWSSIRENRSQKRFKVRASCPEHPHSLSSFTFETLGRLDDFSV